MAIKLYDICATTGKYTDNSGKERNRYLNVGSVIKGDYGAYIMLNAHFNPAGIPRKEGSDSIVLSLFKKDKDNGPAPAMSQDSQPQNFGFNEPQSWNPDNPNDIPF